jgi:hypothetical protein
MLAAIRSGGHFPVTRFDQETVVRGGCQGNPQAIRGATYGKWGTGKVVKTPVAGLTEKPLTLLLPALAA